MDNLGPPPLPPGWTEHVGPGGQHYYYHASSQQSTYIRPLPPFSAFPTTPAVAEAGRKKKERPLIKTPIPGTEWLRVKTTEGNIFYTHKGRKESHWVVPEEIRDAVDALEHAESRGAEASAVTATAPQYVTEAELIQQEQHTERKPTPLEEVIITKRPRTEEVKESDDEVTEDEHDAGARKESRKAAAHLAAEAGEKEMKEASPATAKEKPQLSIPDRVDLSLEEAKALFQKQTLLREKDINPLHPWDTSLPIFVSDPRYVLLPSVKSTRCSWTDFRRTWKKDRRFYGWGRDDREREKRFKEFLKNLGNVRILASHRADFFSLLRESGLAQPGSLWKDIKRELSHDPRYDAVGSSSLREELFNTFVKARLGSLTNDKSGSIKDNEEMFKATETREEDSQHRKLERKQRALKEREEKVRVERGRVEAEIGRSRVDLNKEESEREFRTLLTDAIRDPQLTWDAALQELQIDPRFIHSALPGDRQLRIFHAYMNQLRAKHLSNLHALFESHTPSLATVFSMLPIESLSKALPATKLGLDVIDLEREFEKWQRERTHEARNAFDDMLSENAFVDFWGRLGKLGGEGIDGGVKADDLGEGEGEGFGGTVDMKALAKNVDLDDIVKVLKNDKRYIVFDHVPEQRERWIRCISYRITWLVCSRPSFHFMSMRLLRQLVLIFVAISPLAFAQDASSIYTVKHSYQLSLYFQSDVVRLRKIVINRDVFLRELISNANDALEKLRIVSLTEKGVWDGTSPLNVTVKAERDATGKGGRIIITDTGIGMSAEELATNLGTLAKSGTSDFLATVEGEESSANTNLIGAFGVGFYSSFLVADKVTVASVPPKSSNNPNPIQSIFSSTADESSFEIFPDPRGNTLGHGTEITLVLKADALDYLAPSNLMKLIHHHSSFSTAFPIYLWNEVEEEIPVEEGVGEVDNDTPQDDAEAVVEDTMPAEAAPTPEKQTRTVKGQSWTLNSDPKTVSDEEYHLLYQATFKDFRKPLAWSHFTGDSGSGVSFRAIIYVPSYLDETFFSKPLESNSRDVKLLVKHVFITSDLGEYNLPKWASWVRVIIDAEDLPLNVSREMLQSSAFLKQIRGIVVRRLIQLFTKISEEDPEKFAEISKVYRTVLKLGAAEDQKNRGKIVPLLRFDTNQRNTTSLDDYVKNKKQGQKQIFYLADMGKPVSHLAGSVFVEKLDARGYEVLLLNEPLDEILVQTLRTWKGFKFQDVAKAGLDFGDDTEEDKDVMADLQEKYAPLLEWLKFEAQEVVRDVVLSHRLVTSPCAIVADNNGLTANIQKLISATNRGVEREDFMQTMMKKQKVLEINPRSPLIEGLLHRVETIASDDEEKDRNLEELREVASILVDSALVRSGFEVADSNKFLSRVDRVLRRSLGVSEAAPTDDTVKPAPPVDPEMPDETFEDQEQQLFNTPDWLEDQGFKVEIEEIDDEGNVVHDEL
ncbi:Hsp90 protein-domain-containing protein [Pisolithus croceorrhizus]|nr:Hsp90 protein-domain-containing protein [Pisolithus croceorrhizus]